MKVQRDGRNVTVEVTADGEGLVSHAGSALLSQIADKSGLTKALSAGLAGMRERVGGHCTDPMPSKGGGRAPGRSEGVPA